MKGKRMKTYTAQVTVNGETLAGLMADAYSVAGQFLGELDGEVMVDLSSTRSLSPGQWTATATLTVVTEVVLPDPEEGPQVEPLARPAIEDK